MLHTNTNMHTHTLAHERERERKTTRTRTRTTGQDRTGEWVVEGACGNVCSHVMVGH